MELPLHLAMDKDMREFMKMMTDKYGEKVFTAHAHMAGIFEPTDDEPKEWKSNRPCYFMGRPHKLLKMVFAVLLSESQKDPELAVLLNTAEGTIGFAHTIAEMAIKGIIEDKEEKAERDTVI